MTVKRKGRVGWIDIAKAVVIILVVFGHAMRGGAARRVVYSFHVAAFYFLAGMTCKTDQVGKRIKTDVLRIMVPYYCFGLISIAVYAVLGNFAAASFGMDVDTSVWVNFKDLLYANAEGRSLQFNTPLWFLPCLFATKLLYYAVDRMSRGKTGRIVAATLVLAAVGFGYSALKLPNPPFSLAVALKMLPLFALGRVFFQYVQAAEIQKFRRSALFGAGAALLLLACVVGYRAPKVNYAADAFPNIAAFCFTASFGSLGICLLSMAVEHNRLLEYIGKETLAILVMHKFPILLFQTVGPFKGILAQSDTITGNLCGGVPVSLVSIAMSLAAAVVVKRFFPFMLGVRRESKKA